MAATRYGLMMLRHAAVKTEALDTLVTYRMPGVV
jgi:hypothetical protein